MSIRGIERQLVRHLGDQIGFGRIMHLASEEWETVLVNRGPAAGGSFVVGPCRIFTVPCECENPKSCDWCCGSRWLTKHVKKIKEASAA